MSYKKAFVLSFPFLRTLPIDWRFLILDSLPKDNQHLDDLDPNKFVAKMGGEALWFLLSRIDLDTLSYDLRSKASNETSQQRKQEALK